MFNAVKSLISIKTECFALEINQLFIYSGGDVYKIFLSNKRLWEQKFAKILADSLLSSDLITRQNARKL